MAARPSFFIYRTDRLRSALDDGADDLEVIEQGRRKWRIADGDSLVFTEGRGLEVRFVAIARVLNVVSKEDDEGTTTTLRLGQLNRLPNGLLLSRLMFSLTMVSNLGRPWLHMRHKSRIPVVDVESLRNEKIAWDRTVFFGLLRALPAGWRQLLEAESRSLGAGERLREPTQRAHSRPEPVEHLLTLLRSNVVTPARLAVEVHASWSQRGGAQPLAELQVVEADGAPESWSIGRMLQTAVVEANQLEHHWALVTDLPFRESLQGEQYQWRPHRW